MREDVHPLVANYLTALDVALSRIPRARRAGLRAEIESHLVELIPGTASEADAALVLLEFGTPDEIVAQELHADTTPGRRRSVRSTAVVGSALLLVAALVGGAVVLGGTQLPAVMEAAEPQTSVVVENPQGPERITTGLAYEEYLAEVDASPALPPGAQWPRGIPAGLDAGKTEDGSGALQVGVGATTAQFTWLCAWEGEYLAAEEAGDDKRLAAASAALVDWTGEVGAILDPDAAWRMAVIEPMTFADSSGIRKDFPQSCAQAAIFGVPN